jgi:hypothetical protein
MENRESLMTVTFSPLRGEQFSDTQLPEQLPLSYDSMNSLYSALQLHSTIKCFESLILTCEYEEDISPFAVNSPDEPSAVYHTSVVDDDETSLCVHHHSAWSTPMTTPNSPCHHHSYH